MVPQVSTCSRYLTITGTLPIAIRATPCCRKSIDDFLRLEVLGRSHGEVGYFTGGHGPPPSHRSRSRHLPVASTEGIGSPAQQEAARGLEPTSRVCAVNGCGHEVAARRICVEFGARLALFSHSTELVITGAKSIVFVALMAPDGMAFDTESDIDRRLTRVRRSSSALREAAAGFASAFCFRPRPPHIFNRPTNQIGVREPMPCRAVAQKNRASPEFLTYCFFNFAIAACHLNLGIQLHGLFVVHYGETVIALSRVRSPRLS